MQCILICLWVCGLVTLALDQPAVLWVELCDSLVLQHQYACSRIVAHLTGCDMDWMGCLFSIDCLSDFLHKHFYLYHTLDAWSDLVVISSCYSSINYSSLWKKKSLESMLEASLELKKATSLFLQIYVVIDYSPPNSPTTHSLYLVSTWSNPNPLFPIGKMSDWPCFVPFSGLDHIYIWNSTGFFCFHVQIIIIGKQLLCQCFIEMQKTHFRLMAYYIFIISTPNLLQHFCCCCFVPCEHC